MDTPRSNPELELAYEYVCHTNKCIFLTGKAGTGKTTFLRSLQASPPKRLAVVAPTGVAAINAGGMTIHSFFQLPFGPYVPGNTRDASRMRRFNKRKINLIRSLDLLIIDEISMVRADLLDGIDEVLRRYRNPLEPFGGVQLLMIGDLHQLPPVVKEEDWSLLRSHYETPFFFSSKAYLKTDPVAVQLKHIYRQSDERFIRLLNKVRNNEVDEEVLTTLNSRYRPAGEIKEEEAYITLTTHNASARRINAQKLAELPGKVFSSRAVIDGNFPASSYPADENLELKTGAQVMFIKNDPLPEKRYYNGKIGKIVRIDEEAEEIHVLCPEEEAPIAVGLAEWSNRKYTLDEKAKEVAEEVVGTFTQYPLRLAWAITIHKSQGLTFDRVILDAQAAFAHGQVYVALSRCRSFEGIVLRSRIQPSGVRTDAQVKRFSEEAEQNAPGEERLRRDKAVFQEKLLLELFGFETFRKKLARMERVLLEHESKLLPGAADPFAELQDKCMTDIFPVAEKFRAQIRRYAAQGGLPEENAELQERVRKAADWFSENLAAGLQPLVQNIRIMTDNKQVQETAEEAHEQLRRELFVRHACFRTARNGFSAQDYLHARADAELDYERKPARATSAAPRAATPGDTPHPALFARLTAWRTALGTEQDLPLYRILPTRTLLAISERLPADRRQLKAIHGIGRRRLDEFGEDLIDIVQTYCRENDLEPAPELPYEAPEPSPSKAPKPNTREVTLELYRSGKSIAEIAEERGLVRGTIEGHLADFIRQGELSISAFMETEAVRRIAEHLAEQQEAFSLSEVKSHFGDAYSYGELKMVMAHVERGGNG